MMCRHFNLLVDKTSSSLDLSSQLVCAWWSCREQKYLISRLTIPELAHTRIRNLFSARRVDLGVAALGYEDSETVGDSLCRP